jgi:hypothetical protein
VPCKLYTAFPYCTLSTRRRPGVVGAPREEADFAWLDRSCTSVAVFEGRQSTKARRSVVNGHELVGARSRVDEELDTQFGTASMRMFGRTEQGVLPTLCGNSRSVHAVHDGSQYTHSQVPISAN